MNGKRSHYSLFVLLLLLITVFAAGPSAQAQTNVFVEPFDDASQLTTSTPFFSDAGVSSGFDFFGISDGAGGGDFGGDPAPNVKAYTGFDDSFLTGMDLDGEGAQLPVTLEWTDIDVSGLTAIEFSGDFAEFFDDPGDIDAPDFILVEYQLDGGGFQNLISFRLDEAEPDEFNGVFREDTDFNGTGDGVTLGRAAQSFTKTIPGTGSALDLRLTVSLDSGDEDFAVDNFIIREAVAGPTCESTAIADVQGTGNVTPYAGQEVTIRGLVTADFGSELMVQESSTEPRSGIVVFSSGNTASRGDEVCVSGIASERFGQTQVGGNDNPNAVVDILSSGNSLPAPVLVSSGDVATGAATAEQWEAVLVRIEDATVVNDNLGFGEFSVDDGSGAVRVDDKGSYSYIATSGDFLPFVQGPLNFTFGDYKIEPRDDDDIAAPTTPPLTCDGSFTLTPIHDIQGSGETSPLVGETVVVEGIVVGDFQNNAESDDGDLDGFFLQEEDGDADSDSATSEGIFIFDGSSTMDVATDDRVRVLGSVSEFFDMTQITVSELAICEGPGEATPAEVTLPVNSIGDFEAFEGMSVDFPQQLYISEFFNFDRFGEIVLTTERQFQPTAVFEPGSTQAADLAMSNDLSRITLDDGRSNQNPDPARHPNGNEFTLDNRFRGGDIVQNVSGVLNYSFGLYRIQPTAGADFSVENPRPNEPEDVGGNITVAAFNVLNYFNTLDDGVNDICGPQQDQECRGADNEEERIRQLDKIVSAMATMEADVLGIIEVENTDGVEAMADIVGGLNAIFGPDTYAYVDTGTIGADVIKVGFIYKTSTVTPVGDFAVLDSDEFVDPNNLGDPKNRPALAQTFMDDEFGDRFTAVVNHFKSKGSPCGEGDDHPEQGSCNLTRTLAAQVLADWLATDPTGTGASDVLIIGDLNSYDKEDPIDVLKANGYADLVFEHGGEFAYSFVFDGQFGYLDYAMANQAALSRITGTTVWHNNTDEPDILDYDTTFKQDAQDALYEPNAFRSSDHDPVIVGICERPDVVLTPDVLWPANHMYVDVTATVFVDGQAANGNATFVSVTSNEPDNGEDDGDTINDIVQIDDFTFQLRAERSGVGTGRVYTVTYEVLDACGGVQAVSGTVTVPLSLEGGGGRGRQNNPNR